MAVKVTDPPAQIVVADAFTVTEGVTEPVTDMVMLLLVTVTGRAQLALLVSTQVTTSLLARVVVVNVALLVPALFPFILH